MTRIIIRKQRKQLNCFSKVCISLIYFSNSCHVYFRLLSTSSCWQTQFSSFQTRLVLVQALLLFFFPHDYYSPCFGPRKLQWQYRALSIAFKNSLSTKWHLLGNCSGTGVSDWFASLWTDTGAMLLLVFITKMDNRAEYTLSKFVDNIK